MNPDLLLALADLQAAIQKATAAAKQDNNEPVFRELRRMGWAAADLTARAVPDRGSDDQMWSPRCESPDAEWLPFRPLATIKAGPRSGTSREAVWP